MHDVLSEFVFPTRPRRAARFHLTLQPLQIGAHIGSVLVTQVAIFFQSFIDNAFQFAGQVRIQPHRRHWRLVQDGFEQQRSRVPAERQRACRHLVQHRAKRKQIGARIERLAARLLRRHISHRADRRSRRGQLVHAEVGLGRIPGNRRFQLGQTKIENLPVPAAGDKNIGRLNVAVNDALGVRRIERIGHIDRNSQQRLQFERRVVDGMLQRQAIQKFHDDEGAAVGLPDVVNRADVGMIQRRGRLRLAMKSAQRLGIACHAFGKELQRDETVEARVLGFVDHAHAAAAQLLQDPVMRDGLADHCLSVMSSIIDRSACKRRNHRIDSGTILERSDKRVNFRLTSASGGPEHRFVANIDYNNPSASSPAARVVPSSFMSTAPQFVTAGYGMAAVAAWGTSDFLGGYATRRANAFLFTAVFNLGGLLLVGILAGISHAPFPCPCAARSGS